MLVTSSTTGSLRIEICFFLSESVNGFSPMVPQTLSKTTDNWSKFYFPKVFNPAQLQTWNLHKLGTSLQRCAASRWVLPTCEAGHHARRARHARQTCEAWTKHARHARHKQPQHKLLTVKLTGELFKLTCVLFRLTGVLFRLTGVFFRLTWVPHTSASHASHASLPRTL